MSIADRRILNQSGLSQSQVAELLGVKNRQTVGHGIGRDEHDYLNFERCDKIAESLKKTDPERLRRFITALEANGRKYAEGLSKYLDDGDLGRLKLGEDPFKTFKKELWIFANEPAELEFGDFLEFMAEKHFCKKNRRYVYFLTPGQNADQLAQIIRYRIDQLRKLDKPVAQISVITTNAMTLVPHLLIGDATVMDDGIEPKGYVRVEPVGLRSDENADTPFYKLPHAAVTAIINSVRTAGIGLSWSMFFPDEMELYEPLRATKDTFYSVLFTNETKE